MQHPWTQFATDYTEKGNQYPSMYPHSPVQMSVPSYNRSPAPFNSVSHQQTPMHEQYTDHQQTNFHQEQQPYQQSQQWTHNNAQSENYQEQLQHQQQYHQLQHESQPPNHKPPNHVKNVREDPDFDEDFPSYKELRKVFVDKQKDVRKDERYRQKATKGVTIGKPPSPRGLRKPSALESPRETAGYQSTSRSVRELWSEPRQIDNPSPSPQKPRRIFSQVSHQAAPEHQRQTNWQQRAPASPRRRRSSSFTQADRSRQPSSRYQEVPVLNTNNEGTASWQHITPNRESVRHRPPMSVYIPTQTDGPTKVVITSNSPRSPQKATYIPDGDDQNLYHQPGFAVYNSPSNILSMSRTDNHPKRRRSYAEVLITHNSLPRNFTTKSMLSQQTSHEGTLMNGVGGDTELFPRQRRYNTLSTSKKGNSSSSWQRQYSTPDGSERTDAVDMRHHAMGQMLYAPTSPSPHFQQPTSGWQYHQPVVGGPHVVHTPSNAQPGKSAAHLQFNSPMALYSTQNAQQALAKDQEAAELLKITGPDGKPQGAAITLSPTLQAVLREDRVKRKTGYKPNVGYYHNHKEYGPGYGPLRQYEEVPDTLCQSITSYNQQQDRSLAYPMWSECS